MSLLSPLNLLLSVQSKTVIEQAIVLVFLTRHQPFHNEYNYKEEVETPLKRFRNLLAFETIITDKQLYELRNALLECIKVSLSNGSQEDLAEFFEEEGADVNPKLKQIIGQIIISRAESWKEVIALNKISLPNLIDTNWSLHFIKSSNTATETLLPRIRMNLSVLSLPSSTCSMSQVEEVSFECSRDTLDTMIDGLGKIRDQLQSMK